MKTALTALVSAVIGGLVTALFIFVGISGLQQNTDSVTIKEVAPPKEASGTTPVAGEGASVREVYKRDGRGVVSVDVAATSEAGPAGGSGFVVDEAGHIVTNQHVVEDAENISVRFSDGTRRAAEVVGEDPSTDVAVIEVDAPREALEPLTLGDSNSVGVGEPVIAIGNPLNVGISVTTGIVSGVGRPIKAPNNYTINDAVQTDAAINPGNSGGPLVNASGDVVGMDTAVAGDAQNIGFALAIDNVKPVADKLRTGGTEPTRAGGTESTPRAVLGVSLQDDGSGSGAVIGQTAQGSPAAKAGLRAGDVVTAVDGKDISSADDLVAALKAHKPGDSVSITWSRQGTQHTAKVELAAS